MEMEVVTNITNGSRYKYYFQFYFWNPNLIIDENTGFVLSGSTHFVPLLKIASLSL